MELHRMLKVLGDQTRWDLIDYLLKEALCGRALAARLGISQAAVSKHIRNIQETGLITATKKGYWVYYCVNKKRFRQLQADFNTWFNRAGLNESTPTPKECGSHLILIKKGRSKEALEYCEEKCIPIKPTDTSGKKRYQWGEDRRPYKKGVAPQELDSVLSSDSDHP
jgi:biotin operon repressor